MTNDQIQVFTGTAGCVPDPNFHYDGVKFMSKKGTKAEMMEKLRDLYDCVEDLSGNPVAGCLLEIHDAMKQAIEHVPDDPKPG